MTCLRLQLRIGRAERVRRTAPVATAALGIPDGNVKSRLSRAREALRQRLIGLLEEGESS
jgi:hypothetical protein